MTKKQNVFKMILEYWPLLAVVVSSISSFALLFYRVDHIESSMKHRGEWSQRIEKEVQNIRVDCAKLQGCINGH